jgi:DNA polymerase I-like protein with 3'-5' exonuclease and polymerase domains
VQEVAAAALLARSWPKTGSRHEATLALSGGLLRAWGGDTARVTRFVRAVVIAAHDEEWLERLNDVQSTAKSLQNPKARVTGWPKLGQIVGEHIINRVRSWLENSVTSRLQSPQKIPAKTSQYRPIPPFVPFPVDALPEPWAEYCRQGARILKCDPSYIALPVLSVLAGAMGITRRIYLGGEWYEPAVVWSIVIGESGGRKSPAADLATRFVVERQKRFFREYRLAKDQHRRDVAQHKSHAKTDPLDDQADEEGVSQSAPVAPKLARVLCSDVTIEKLAGLLDDNPRGLLLYRDEIAGWLDSFTKYKGSSGASDEPNWLQMFRADFLCYDRKTGEKTTVFIPHAAVSIVGTIQPAVLKRKMAKGLFESGLPARILLAMPPRTPMEYVDEVIEPELRDRVKASLDKLYDLQSGTNDLGDPQAMIVKLNPQASEHWKAFVNAWGQRQFEADGEVAAALSKLEGYAGRIALLHHLAKAEILEDTDPVSRESLEAGIRIVEWVANETWRIYQMFNQSEQDSATEQLIHLVKRLTARYERGITARDLCRSNKSRYPTIEAAQEALEHLVQLGLGIWNDGSGKPGRGGKVSPLLELCDRGGDNPDEFDLDQDGDFYEVPGGSPNAPTSGGTGQVVVPTDSPHSRASNDRPTQDPDTMSAMSAKSAMSQGAVAPEGSKSAMSAKSHGTDHPEGSMSACRPPTQREKNNVYRPHEDPMDATSVGYPTQNSSLGIKPTADIADILRMQLDSVLPSPESLPTADIADILRMQLDSVLPSPESLPTADIADILGGRANSSTSLDHALPTADIADIGTAADRKVIVQQKPCASIEGEPSMSNTEVALDPKLPPGSHTTGYRIVDRVDQLTELEAAIRSSSRIGFDIETTGLQPRRDRVRLLSLATNRGTFVIDLFHVDPSSIWSSLRQVEIVGHNLLFDMTFLHTLGFTPDRVFDTLLASQVLEAGDLRVRHSLQDLAARHRKDVISKDEQTSDWSRPTLSPQQLDYAARDAELPLALVAILENRLSANQLGPVAQLEMRAFLGILAMSVHGVGFDTGSWKILATQAEIDVARLEDEMNALSPGQADLFGQSPRNWNSTTDVKQAFAALGYPVERTDDDTLATIDHPLAEHLREHRSAVKRSGTYGDNWLRHVEDDRVYPGWRQIGAGSSGRMSCAEPNVQQLPRDPRYRRCFVAPPGRVLVQADYSQIELRLAAKIAPEPTMYQAYKRGEDLHLNTARAILGVQHDSKAQRQLAKALNFGLLYGMGVPSLARYAQSNYGLTLSEAEAHDYRRKFFATYPGLAQWHRREGATPQAITTRTVLGRQRRDVLRFTEKLNTPVQGSGADGLKAALALCWERRHQVPEVKLVLAIHDEIVLEVDQDDAIETQAWLVQVMIDGMQPYCNPVPVEVESRIVSTWGG